MEVTLVNRSVYELPSKQRVDCLVYDGTADMQLWPGPGPDRDLLDAYGDDLQRSLDVELKQVEGRLLEIPSVIRVQPGRLHCNFLAWIATRAPEPGSDREPAPNVEVLKEAVLAALRFASERNVERIAFPALGAGYQEESREDRLVAIVQAAHEYHEQCAAEGRAPGVEEVLVCEASGPAFRTAKKRLAGLAKAAEPEAPKKAAKKTAKKAAKKRSTSTRKSTAKPKITADELEKAQLSAAPYSMKANYIIGDFFNHPKFGIAKVIDIPAPGSVAVVFEDGALKRMVHQRP